MKATLTNYRQSPRKVRLVASAISGKSVDNALIMLRFLVKRGASPMEKLLKSAVANALVTDHLESADLMIKSVEVNKGVVLKRMMPRAMGSAARINKRTSHISIVLAKKADKGAKKADIDTAPKATEAKEVKPKKPARPESGRSGGVAKKKVAASAK